MRSRATPKYRTPPNMRSRATPKYRRPPKMRSRPTPKYRTPPKMRSRATPKFMLRRKPRQNMTNAPRANNGATKGAQRIRSTFDGGFAWERLSRPLACPPARTHARTKRNDFPVGLTPQPPISSFAAPQDITSKKPRQAKQDRATKARGDS